MILLFNTSNDFFFPTKQQGAFRARDVITQDFYTGDRGGYQENRKAMIKKKVFSTDELFEVLEQLPSEVVDALSLAVFKARLDGALGNLV